MARHEQLAMMDAQQLRTLAAELIEQLAGKDGQLRRRDELIIRNQQVIEHAAQELKLRDLRIDQLVHEMAVLKRWKFAARSEQLNSEQRSLLDEAIDADLKAMDIELDALRAAEGM